MIVLDTIFIQVFYANTYQVDKEYVRILSSFPAIRQGTMKRLYHFVSSIPLRIVLTNVSILTL